MRRVLLLSILAGLVNFGCSSNRQQAVESARKLAKSCETRSKRSPEEHFAAKAHTPDGKRLETVTINRGEQLCLTMEETEGRPGRLRVVESTQGPALGITLTGADMSPVLWVNNQFPKALGFSAAVRLKGTDGAFPSDACPVPPRSLGEQRWEEEVEEVSLSDFGWVSSQQTKDCS